MICSFGWEWLCVKVKAGKKIERGIEGLIYVVM